ncbi:LD-carboxypeptidase, partial [Deltaproteobacteria bacterium OttesenSCG-928-M10]|nr:LD-carboxypeptidase [Deltaproteobacteria bacterium OttesenSCG-928-M10]
WNFSGRSVIKKGRADGPALGGNLTLVAALLAGPWLPDFEGAVLFLEEVDEPAYRLDRLLTTVRHSPMWTRARALVFGQFTRCGPPAEVNRLLREAAAGFAGPVLFNAPFGHESRNRFLPLGAMVAIEG